MYEESCISAMQRNYSGTHRPRKQSALIGFSIVGKRGRTLRNATPRSIARAYLCYYPLLFALAGKSVKQPLLSLPCQPLLAVRNGKNAINRAALHPKTNVGNYYIYAI